MCSAQRNKPLCFVFCHKPIRGNSTAAFEKLSCSAALCSCFSLRPGMWALQTQKSNIPGSHCASGLIEWPVWFICCLLIHLTVGSLAHGGCRGEEQKENLWFLTRETLSPSWVPEGWTKLCSWCESQFVPPERYLQTLCSIGELKPPLLQ